MKDRSVAHRPANRTPSALRNLLLPFFLSICIAALLLSCPPPFEDTLTQQVGDELGPKIVISSPLEGSTYRSTITVTGTISDDVADTGDGKGSLARAHYSLPYTTPTIEGEIDIAEDGTFSFTCSTENLTGEQKIIITAQDWNWNLTVSELTLINWSDGPYIELSTPEDAQYYSSSVIVEGRVGNSFDNMDANNEVASLSWTVQPGGLGDTLIFGSDGTFSSIFETTDLQGSLTLAITAEDKNGNETTVYRSLLDAGNDIPSFVVTPGDGVVTLDWAPVPLAEEYTVYYTINGSLPSTTYGTEVSGASPGMEITGLPNGALCIFRLHATSAGAPEAWSDYVRSIPLSPITLAPHVAGGSDSIIVSWPEIDGAQYYEVWRSDYGSEEYENISGEIAGTSFTDALVIPEIYYKYCVKPADYNDELSQPGIAMAFPVPEKYPHQWRFSYDTPGNCKNIAPNGDYLYVADDTAFRCLQLGETSASQTDYMAFLTNDVHAMGTTVYGVGGSSLSKYNLSVSSNIVKTDEYSNDTELYKGYAVYADGSRQYIGGYNEQIRILDMDLGEPLIWSSGTGGVGQDITIAGGYLIVSTYYNLRIFNMNGGEISYSHCTGGALGVAALWPYVYVADENDGLRIFDCTNPASPSQFGDDDNPYDDTPGVASDLAIDGSLLYLADGYAGVRIYDVTVSDAPVYRETIDTVGSAQGVAAENGSLYIADGYSGVHGYYIDRYVPDIAVPPSDPFEAGSSLAFYGNTLLTAEGLELSAYSLNADGSITFIDSIDVTIDGECAAISGETLFLASGTALVAVDISDPNAMTTLDTIQTDGFAWDLDSYGHYVYGAFRSGGFQVARLSQGQLEVISSIIIPDECMEVVVEYPYAYLAGLDSGIHVLDVSDPESPRIIGSCGDADQAWGIAVQGDYAYVAAGNNGLKIIDISDPRFPSLVGSCAVPSTNTDVILFGDTACVTTFENGVQLVNITDPTAPRLLAAPPDPGGYAKRSIREGRYLVTSCYSSSGSYIVDLMNTGGE